MARFDLAWPLAGALAAGLSAVVLGALAAARGLPVWMPLNATSHGLHGPQAATVTALDLAHTGLGAAIHVGSSFFWAAVAVFLLRRAASGDMRLAWLAGLATATIAGLVDYGLMPARLRPGWELVLPPLAVVAGLVALGVGLSLGLAIAHSIGRPPAAGRIRQGRERGPRRIVMMGRRKTRRRPTCPTPPSNSCATPRRMSWTNASSAWTRPVR
ncbi:hypothetical protein DIE28_11485 [Paracoccus thiocyanatus]|uniref:Uncharacterized protein n=2 Tax=Paracoccus thiocyanatus TaxID=34006 RepID=A0A3D8PB09_9RHOB|nr:hypothetical protein DIE28_11485 [Paracoccus thiocyanatus]